MRVMFYLTLVFMTAGGTYQQEPTVCPSSTGQQPSTQLVYVVGYVRRPTSLPVDGPITLLQAIGRAGGTTPEKKNNVVRVLRRTPGCEYVTQIRHKLRDLYTGRIKDILLQANDIVEVRPLNRVSLEQPDSPIPCNPPNPTIITILK
jgi:hypothetical protein